MVNYCPACQSTKLAHMFDMGNQPMSLVNLTRCADESATLPRRRINLMICRNCSHVHNIAFYDVPYKSGCCMYNSGIGWQKHIENTLQLLSEIDAEYVVEIGAGDCDFLSRLKVGSVKMAVDPCDGIAYAAEKHGLDFRKEYFDAYKHMPEGTDGTLVIMRHLLEHAAYPRDLLESICARARDLKSPTHLYIEVPCCEKALKAGRIEDWTYEHAQHFTADSMRALLGNCGLDNFMVLAAYGGEVLSVFARTQPSKRSVDVDGVLKRYHDIEDGIQKVARRLEGKRVAYWGGAGKSAMFLNKFGIQRDSIVVDSDSKKWGMFVPGTTKMMHPPSVLTFYKPQYIIATAAWRANDVRDEIICRDIWCDAFLKFENGELVEVPLVKTT